MVGDQMRQYLLGEKLCGDDYTADQIVEWFHDEAEGYAALGSVDRGAYQYGYHALNVRHGFRHLPARPFSHVLSIGGAYGHELHPLLSRTKEITILDPSDAFVVRNIGGVPVSYVKPHPSGQMIFKDETFDVITCFGCLHHVPNISTVMKELFRCTTIDGYVLIREPIISMGDWSRPREGLTSRERGIPLPLFRQIIQAAGFRVEREALCVFSLTSRLRWITRGPVFNSVALVCLDRFLSRLFSWNQRYHPQSPLQKLLPTAVAYVLTRPPHPV